jgi:hypothetical protein
MIESKIIAVGESPTNEGTLYYAVGLGCGGYKTVNYKRVYEWTCGGIILKDDRVYVHDTHGKIRVNLPYANCYLHYDPAKVGDDE